MTSRLGGVAALLAGLGVAVLVLTGCPQPQSSAPAVTPPAPPKAVAEPPPTATKALEPAAMAPPKKPARGWQPYNVAATILTRKHPFYTELEQGLRDTAAQYHVDMDIQSAEMNSSTQRDQIQDFLAKGKDAIIVCPADSASVGGAIALANQAKVPVFTSDIAADEGDVVCHVASDNMQGGRLAAEYLAKLLGDQGDVLIIDHPTVRSAQDRVKGFEAVITEKPGIRIVDKPAAGGLRDKAFEKTQNALTANPNVKGIFGINDDSALGALSAVEQAKRTDILIVGYDATPEARKAILRGSQLQADVVQYPQEIARLTVEAVVKYLNGEQVPKEVPVPVGIWDRETAAKEGAAP